jgi:alpha-tubulin suppressor-like RCC1 family protein
MSTRQPDEYPKSTIELLLHPDRDKLIESLFELKRALENAVVVKDGVKYPLRLSPHNAVVDLDAPVGEGSVGTVIPPVLELTVDDVNDELEIAITLTDTYDAIHLERGTDGIAFTPLITLAGDATSHVDDTVLADGTEYFYRARGVRSEKLSLYSNVVSGALTVAAGSDLIGWGENGNSQLGDGLTTDLTSPTTLQTPTDFVKVVCGSAVLGGAGFSIGLKADGTIWSVGANNSGQLGHGNTTPLSTWTKIGTDTNWADVAAGRAFAVARKTTGAIYSWGEGGDRALGHGNQTDQLSPLQIGVATDWAFINAGHFNTVAIKTDNTLYVCGRGAQGQIGDGNNTSTATLTQVAGTTWLRAYPCNEAVFGIKTDGTAHGWGYNGDGQLGLGSGSSTNYSTPEPIGAGTNWKAFSGGELFNAATKTDDTLWVTGLSTDGALGLGATTQVLDWTQITGTDWDYPKCGISSTMALKTSGTVFGTGLNSSGQLGVGDTTARTAFTQSGVATGYTYLDAGFFHVLALKTP